MRFARFGGLVAASALTLTLAVPALAASAKLTVAVGEDGGTPTAGKTWVRVLHGSPDAPEVDVYVGADLASAAKVDALSGLSFGDISAYAEVDPGTYAIKVCATADSSICPIEVASLALAADSKVTIAASDALASIDVNVFTDAPGDNAAQAQVRVVHLSADTPAVDVLTQDGAATVVDNLAYPVATGYLALDAGSYDLKVCADADNTVCPLDPGALVLEAGKAYSVFAIGSLQATIAVPATDTVASAPAGTGMGAPALLLAMAAALGLVVGIRFVPARARNQ